MSKEVSADSQEAKAQAAKEKGALEGTLSSPGGATGGAIATSSLSSRLAGWAKRRDPGRRPPMVTGVVDILQWFSFFF